MADPMIGKVIQNYKIIEPIGEGGMGAVYKAEHIELGNVLAVKILGLGREASEKDRSRFLQEAKALAALKHNNIVSILDFVEQDGIYFMLMEYVEGQTLGEILDEKAGLLPISRTARIISQIARGLDYAHNRGIVHRDIKPANIVISDDDRVVIMDFGIAKLLEGSTMDLTHDNVAIGTPAYMSPEQASGKPIDSTSDVYSLGVVLFQMLTGQRPFSGPTPIDFISQHVSQEIPSAREINQSLSKRQDEIIRKSLAKDPKERYARAGDLAQELVSTYSGSTEIGIDRGSWFERFVEGRTWGVLLRIGKVFQMGVFQFLGLVLRLLLSITLGAVIVILVASLFASFALGNVVENRIVEHSWPFDQMGVGYREEKSLDQLANTIDITMNQFLPNTLSNFRIVPNESKGMEFWIKADAGDTPVNLLVGVELKNNRPVFYLDQYGKYSLSIWGSLFSRQVNNGLDAVMTEGKADLVDIEYMADEKTIAFVIDGPGTITQNVMPIICQSGMSFTDNFSDIFSGWAQTYVTSEAEVGYLNSGYVLKTFQPNIIVKQSLPCDYSDFEMSVKTTRTDAIEDAIWGLVFNESAPGSFWVFQVNQLGWYSVVDVEGDQVDFVVPWSQSNKEVGLDTNLGISIADGKLILLINSSEISSVSIDETISGKVGLFLRSGNTGQVNILFDDFEVKVSP